MDQERKVDSPVGMVANSLPLGASGGVNFVLI